MNAWIDDLHELCDGDERSVIVTVAGVRGSAPRETGARMIVTRTQTIGSIGGGQLEYQCTGIAARQLGEPVSIAHRKQRRFPLGTNCGQCCGGVVDILFEHVASKPDWLATLKAMYDERQPVVIVTPLDRDTGRFLVCGDRCMHFDTETACPDDIIAAARSMLGKRGGADVCDEFLLEPVRQSGFEIAVFGAGHVGAATVDALARLDCVIRWVDSRRSIFPARLPHNVTAVESSQPAREVAAMPGGAHYLVMTHSHPLDFEICDAVLRRGDFAYCGLIGSVSKRRRFERDMRKQGLPDAQLERLTCPIGVTGIASKKPADIAIAVAAELLRVRDTAESAGADRPDVPANVRIF